jgi:hypothetical protein
MNSRKELEIRGTQPSIEGALCEEIIVVQYWFAGSLAEPANTIHLKFNGVWHQLCFDCGVIFWRNSDGPPMMIEAPEIQAEYRLDDIGRRHGLLGMRLASIDSEPTPAGARVALTFQGGRTAIFFDEHDRSDYAC